jgi:hypothetical protein
MRWLGLPLAIAGSLLILSTSAAGQMITGRVLVETDTVGVDGAGLTLLDLEGNPVLRSQSDEDGYFRIPVPSPGQYEIRSERIGFASAHSGFFAVGREILEIELRMAETAIPVDPILVVARREIRSGTLDEYYDRMEENRTRGIGNFVTAEEIERQASFNASTLLRGVPSMEVIPSGTLENQVWMRVGGGRCRPNLYLDGLPLLLSEFTQFDHVVKPGDLEGIEIYNRGDLDQVHGYVTEPCGAILLWRKRDWGSPFSFKKLGLVLGLGAIVFLVGGGS